MVGYVIPFSSKGEDDRRDTHRVTQTDNEEASVTVRRWEVGNDRGGSSGGSSRSAVGNELYRETTGNRVTVGGIT